MFKIHTKSGDTMNFDLSDASQVEEWIDKLKRADFQSIITGLSTVQQAHGRARCANCRQPTRMVCQRCGEVHSNMVLKTGVQYSVSRPLGFRSVLYEARYIPANKENRMHGGEKVLCTVDDVQLGLMVHPRQPACRITLSRIGKRRYNPG